MRKWYWGFKKVSSCLSERGYNEKSWVSNMYFKGRSWIRKKYRKIGKMRNELFRIDLCDFKNEERWNFIIRDFGGVVVGGVCGVRRWWFYVVLFSVVSSILGGDVCWWIGCFGAFVGEILFLVWCSGNFVSFYGSVAGSWKLWCVNFLNMCVVFI